MIILYVGTQYAATAWARRNHLDPRKILNTSTIRTEHLRGTRDFIRIVTERTGDIEYPAAWNDTIQLAEHLNAQNGYASTAEIRAGLACAACGYSHEAATHMGPGQAQPVDGSISICIECGHLAFFQSTPEGLGLREATPEERELLLADPGVINIVAGIMNRNLTRSPK
jgi:hypothetical protein